MEQNNLSLWSEKLFVSKLDKLQQMLVS